VSSVGWASIRHSGCEGEFFARPNISLKAPILRVARPNVPVSAAPPHEKFVTLGADKIVAAVHNVVRQAT
jgi:pyruvate/2-oxoglutarate/acetoin dehydrogenase E1 component